MTKKFDIPFKSDLVPELLSGADEIRFRCHTDIACYNACCKHADVSLTPYDIVRLKHRLLMPSGDFLKQYTVPYEMDAHGVPGVKLRTDETGACGFVTDKGCSVYPDRPAACRYYPLGLMVMRSKGEPTGKSQYFLVKEAHCKGHDEDRRISIADYRREQEVHEYDELNREWLQIILKKRSGGPAIGKPSKLSLQLFFMCSYDLDRFRRFVSSDSFKNTYELDEGFFQQIGEDIALMKFGFRFLKQVLFGEKTIAEKAGIIEKRLKERRDHVEMRRRAEIERHEKEQDKQQRDSR